MRKILSSATIKRGIFLGIAIAGICTFKNQFTQLWKSTNILPHDNQILKRSKHIKLYLQNKQDLTFYSQSYTDCHKLNSISLDINGVQDFDHLKFFNSLIARFNMYKKPGREIESSSREFDGSKVTYKLQYFSIDQENQKIETQVCLEGDTKENKYSFRISKKGPFDNFEHSLMSDASAVNSSYINSNKMDILTDISKMGYFVVRPENTFSLNDAFDREAVEKKIKYINEHGVTNES